jgi:adenine-specific DNA-methyltransferase
MKLTDNEKREIVKLVEADKPLPDKYQFLLFDDKREVKLVWNGKTNEVNNIVSPFQIIEHVDAAIGDILLFEYPVSAVVG